MGAAVTEQDSGKASGNSIGANKKSEDNRKMMQDAARALQVEKLRTGDYGAMIEGIGR